MNVYLDHVLSKIPYVTLWYMLTLKFNQQGTCGQTWDGIRIQNLKMKFQLWGGSFYNLNMNGNF